MPPVFLHPELELMWEGWPAGSQQLVVTAKTQLEVGGKTAGAASLWWGTQPQLSASKERSHHTDAAWQTASKNYPGCAATEQPLRIPRQKPHRPSVIGPQGKGSAVGKAVGSRLRTGCQETLRGQGGKRAASSPQDAAQRFPRKFMEQKK